ncbi:MAG TPA: hypothetical protein VJP58_07580 [Candidatus Nitrosocosmicus sp.]|nr:hypothetical protein [Candidatus Nitrosocosmicus sp.]
MYEIPGKISRFNISLSIDTLPGPDNNRLIEVNINNKSTSKPPCPIKPLFAIPFLLPLVNNYQWSNENQNYNYNYNYKDENSVKL